MSGGCNDSDDSGSTSTLSAASVSTESRVSNSIRSIGSGRLLAVMKARMSQFTVPSILRTRHIDYDIDLRQHDYLERRR